MNSTYCRHGSGDFAADRRIEIGLNDRVHAFDCAVRPEGIGVVRRERVLVEPEYDKAPSVIGQGTNITREFRPVFGVLEIAPTLILVSLTLGREHPLGPEYRSARRPQIRTASRPDAARSCG